LKPSRKKLFSIALANTPETVRVVRLRDDNSGKAHIGPKDPDYGMLEARRPSTVLRLHTYLHECGHFALHLGARKERWQEEAEAELWACTCLLRAGIPEPERTVRRCWYNVNCALPPGVSLSAWVPDLTQT
jgi:hypothetical protein